jgi:hypothetical protein
MEKPPFGAGTFCPSPVLAFVYSSLPEMSSGMGEGHQQGAFPFPGLQFSRGKLHCLYFAYLHFKVTMV